MTADTSQKLHVNDHIGDFVVTGIEKLPEISGTAFVFSHVPSGSRLPTMMKTAHLPSALRRLLKTTPASFIFLSTPYCADQKPTRLKSHL